MSTLDQYGDCATCGYPTLQREHPEWCWTGHGRTNPHSEQVHLNRAGPHLLSLDEDLIVALYEAGRSTVSIGRQLGVSDTTISDRLHRAGVTMRPRGRRSQVPGSGYARSRGDSGSRGESGGMRSQSDRLLPGPGSILEVCDEGETLPVGYPYRAHGGAWDGKWVAYCSLNCEERTLHFDTAREALAAMREHRAETHP